MEIVSELLFWAHLVALIGAGGSAVAMPVIVAQLDGAEGDARARLFAVARRAAMAARGALVVLIVTGPLLLWLKWDFHAPSAPWFGVKMLLVLVVVGAVIFAGLSLKKLAQGDASVLPQVRLANQVGGIALVMVVLTAVFAFS